jgi:hypothetical protein
MSSNSKAKKSMLQQQSLVRVPSVPSGFEILSDKEIARMKRIEAQNKDMQAKLTAYHKQGKRSANPSNAVRASLAKTAYLAGGHYGLRTQDEISLQLQAYAHSIIDPFSASAPYPSLMAIPSVMFQTKDRIIVPSTTTDYPGEGTFLYKGFYSANWAATGTSNGAAQYRNSTLVPVGYTGHKSGYYSGSWLVANTPEPGAYTLIRDGTMTNTTKQGNIMLSRMCVAKQYAAMIDLYSAARLVSAGFQMRYTGKSLDAEGIVVVAHLPPNVFICGEYDTAVNAQYMAPAYSDLTYEGIATLPGAREYSFSELVGDPVTAHVVPYSAECEDWCPTDYTPSNVDSMANSSVLGFNEGPPCAAGNQRHRALVDSTLLWCSGETATVASGGGRFQVQQIMLGNNGIFGAVVVAWKGADTTGEFEFNMVSNYECIPRNSTFLPGAAGDHVSVPSSGAVRALAAAIPPAVKSKHGPSLGNRIAEAARGIAGVAKDAVMAKGGKAALNGALDFLGIDASEMPAMFGTLADAAVAGLALF